MAKDFVTVKSSIRLPHTRIWHTTVAWRSATIVYGGYAPEETLKDQISVVFYHKSGTWTKQNTYRDFPKHPQRLGANVVNDKMFVFGDDEGKMVVYSLDLHTWIWESFAPSGTSPLGGGLKIASWVYGRKIYCFGAFSFSAFGAHAHASNQFFCYNTYINKLLGVAQC